MASSVIAIAPLLWSSGWPMNHELGAWAERLAVHVAAFRAGDLFPLWWGDGAFGLGAPMPLLYHKLFNALAAAIYLVTESYRWAALAAILLCALLGIYGLRAACAVVSEARASGWLALTFPHLNYAVTDWLVRGAFAEFAAMAVATWLLWWCLRLVSAGQVAGGLPAIALALFLGHSVIAFFGAALVLLAVLVAVTQHRADALAIVRRFLLQLAVSAVLIAPLGVLMIAVMARVNTFQLVGVYEVSRLFEAWPRYFYDASYRWGMTWQRLSVQLDAPLLVAIAVAVAVGALGCWRRRERAGRPSSTGAPAPRPAWILGSKPAWIFLGSSAILLGFLQLPWATPIYRSVPGAAMIQFPWRLLAYLSTVLVVLTTLSLQAACAVWSRPVAPWAAAVAATMIATSPAIRPISYAWIPGPMLEAISAPPGDRWPEYWPRGVAGRPQSGEYLAALVGRGVDDLGGHRCRGEAIAGEYLIREYELTCREASLVALPIATYGVERVSRRSSGGPWQRQATVRAPRSAADPRLRVALPAGEHRLRVELPTVRRLLWPPP